MKPNTFSLSLALGLSLGASVAPIYAAECVNPPTSKALAHSTQPSVAGLRNGFEFAGLPNVDRFRAESGNVVHAVPASGYEGRVQSALFDRALGKPTFLWAHTEAAPAAVGALTVREQLIARARAQLLAEAGPLQLTAAMINQATVTDAQYNGNGPAVVRFQQRIAGKLVFGRTLNVVLDRSGKPVSVSGYFATGLDAVSLAGPAFARSAPQAIAAAWGGLGGVLNAATILPAGTQGEWTSYTANPSGSHRFERNPRVKAGYYALAGRLVPAYYVELFSIARVNRALNAYALIVSASDGSILQRRNLQANATPYTYRVFADTSGRFQPYDSPLGNGYTPFKGAHPTDSVVRTGAASNKVTMINSGLVAPATDDPWLPEGATETIGNHVDACIDSFDNAADGITSTPLNTCTGPIDEGAGDLHGTPNGPNTFDYSVAADSDPSTDEAKQAAVVNLFYINNWLHDWWYNHGFNEEAGNAQTSNFGRGGEEGDPIKAQGQDGSGRSNANMSTPSDGSSPTMQQYLFDGVAIGEVRETAPTDSGPLKFVPASFGSDDYDITAEAVLAADGAGVSPTDGCGAAAPDPTGLGVIPAAPAAPQTSLSGKIAIIDRGNCNFTTKAQFAATSGAAGLIVINNVDSEPITMGNGDIPDPTGLVTVSPTDSLYATLGAVMIRKADGEAIKSQLASGAVTIHMQRSPSIDLDGTLDNQIVAHEYFHYVHHRLTDSSNGQADAMSEGWGDIDGFMLSVRSDDTLLFGNDKYQGAYGLAGYVINNFFSGIRRAPYSTDKTKNAFTLKHISDGEPTPDGGAGASNSEVHSAGEIWAQEVFECYIGILTDPRHSFGEAQSRMQDYIIGGLKATPTDATYTEARDAILSVVYATDFEDYKRCSDGFAKRGNGLNAVAPARDSTDLTGVTESYDPFYCATSGSSSGGSTGSSGGSSPGTPVVVPVADAGRFGGALNSLLLLPMLALGLRRRRRPR